MLEAKIYGFLYLFRAEGGGFRLNFSYGEIPQKKYADRPDCLIVECGRTLPHLAMNKLTSGLKRHHHSNPNRYLLTDPVFTELNRILRTDDDISQAIGFLAGAPKADRPPRVKRDG